MPPQTGDDFIILNNHFVNNDLQIRQGVPCSHYHLAKTLRTLDRDSTQPLVIMVVSRDEQVHPRQVARRKDVYNLVSQADWVTKPVTGEWTLKM